MKAIEMLCGCFGDLEASKGDVLSVPEDCSPKLAKDLCNRGMAKAVAAKAAPKAKPPKEEKE